MRYITIFFVSLMTISDLTAQDTIVYFADAVKSNLPKYNKLSDAEFESGNIERGQALFDSLVQNKLVGSRFDDYTFKSVNSHKVKLSKIKKPVFIVTYASWCVLNKGEIPALNKLAKLYADQIQFIVVFWDVRDDIRKIAHQFNSSIKVCYANESYRNDARVVATLKHTLGFPTSYFLNEDLDVVDIKRGGGIDVPRRTPTKKAIEMNYTAFNDRITGFLDRKNNFREHLAVTD